MPFPYSPYEKDWLWKRDVIGRDTVAKACHTADNQVRILNACEVEINAACAIDYFHIVDRHLTVRADQDYAHDPVLRGAIGGKQEAFQCPVICTVLEVIRPANLGNRHIIDCKVVFVNG